MKFGLCKIPTVFRYQCGAMFGYTQETNALNFETCEWPGNVETDLIPLKKFVQELLRRSRSTCSTFQTAICYIEAIRNKIKIAQDNEQGGRSIRGDQVNNDGRIVIDETVVNNGCNCNPAQLPDNSKCSPCRTQKNILINFLFLYNRVKVETNFDTAFYSATRLPVGASLLSSRFHGRISLVGKIRSRQMLLQQSVGKTLWPPCMGGQPLRARSWLATLGREKFFFTFRRIGVEDRESTNYAQP
jgi:hypothetical protein